MCCCHDPVRPYQWSSTDMSTLHTERNLPWPGVGTGILSINHSGEGRTHTTSCQSSKVLRVLLSLYFHIHIEGFRYLQEGGKRGRDMKNWNFLSSKTHPCLFHQCRHGPDFAWLLQRKTCWLFWEKRMYRYHEHRGILFAHAPQKVF